MGAIDIAASQHIAAVRLGEHPSGDSIGCGGDSCPPGPKILDRKPNDQRPRGNRGHQAGLSRSLSTAAVLDSGRRLLRMEKGRRRQAAVYIHLQEQRPFAFAGLWSAGGAANEIESCTIITTEANELLRPLHTRMPVILDPAEFATWLDPRLSNPDELAGLLRPYPDQYLKLHRLCTLVNSPQFDEPECIDEAEPAKSRARCSISGCDPGRPVRQLASNRQASRAPRRVFDSANSCHELAHRYDRIRRIVAGTRLGRYCLPHEQRTVWPDHRLCPPRSSKFRISSSSGGRPSLQCCG